MSGSPADRRRPRARPPRPAGGRAGELARLRGRNLGTCPNCGRTVYFEGNFTRFDGLVVHVRCPITLPVTPPGARTSMSP